MDILKFALTACVVLFLIVSYLYEGFYFTAVIKFDKYIAVFQILIVIVFLPVFTIVYLIKFTIGFLQWVPFNKK